MRAILIILVSAGTAVAQPAESPEGSTTVWTVGVEPRFGVMLPTSKLHAMAVGGVEVDLATPALDHRLGVGIDLALTQPSYDATAMDPRIPGGMTTYKIEQTEMVVGLVGTYRFADASAVLVPHVGAGPVLHLLKTNETTSVAPGENNATQTQLGLELGGGVDYRVGPGYVAGDVRFIYSNLDTPLAGSTNAGSFALALGYRFVF